MKFLWVALLLCVSVGRAEEIVVLTKTPVAEFRLPDDSVLKNAYAWKRKSAGIMVIHDGGSYFLNFETLPFAWKKAYGLVPADAVDPDAERKKADPNKYDGLEGLYMSPEDAEAYLKKQEEMRFDPHYVSETLRKVDALPRRSVRYFTSADYDDSVDEALFTACICQNLLIDNLAEAKRFYAKLKEKFPESLFEIDTLYPVCEKCAGTKVLKWGCRACAGSGSCVKCEGTGTMATPLESVTVSCSACRSTGQCAACGGDGEQMRQCLACKGVGRIFQRTLCEEMLEEAVATLTAHYVERKQGK